ncbi:MAG: VOC family protein [Candidatus Nitrosocosmicus sp.]|jgi:hypothetical protein
MPAIKHFESPADDIQRAVGFYRDIFNWELEKWANPENPNMDYWFIKTKDEKGILGISGGMMKRQSSDHKVTNYITVGSIDEYTIKITEKGGKIVIPKTEIPNMGYFTVFLDSEGNMLGLYEGKKS